MGVGIKLPWWAHFRALLGYAVLIFYGHLRDIFGELLGKVYIDTPPKGYAPMLESKPLFYTRRLYRRLHDVFNRPIMSCPGSWIRVMTRKKGETHQHWSGQKYYAPLVMTGETVDALNLGSYNYLGFGDPNSPTKPEVFAALEKYGVTTASVRNSLGTTPLHKELEALVAEFVGKEDAMVFGMGFGTNSTGIPALVQKGSLIISDENNHSSIVTGARASGATIAVFKHNDAKDLERVVRKMILEGQPKSRWAWDKILIVVEGIYSMEGETSPLKEIIAVKKKYKCYLFIDEAHSIGALGKTGRGICEHSGVDPKDVDVLMGTFTKSFGSVGGYLAADKHTIDFLRTVCCGSAYSASIAPPAAQQVISAFKIILGRDGTDIGATKLRALKENANWWRRNLIEHGFRVLGDWDSPVVPLLVCEPHKMAVFSRECLKRKIAVVVVGYPAAPIPFSRCRFCISAGHSKKDLVEAFEKMKEIGDLLALRYDSPMKIHDAPPSAY